MTNAGLCDWLKANGLNPEHIPRSAVMEIDVDYPTTMRIEHYVVTDTGALATMYGEHLRYMKVVPMVVPSPQDAPVARFRREVWVG